MDHPEIGKAGLSKILIVDDLAATLQLITDILSRHGYKVVQALNGQEALRIAVNELPDLILLDVRMPEMDGWEVYRRLRANGTFRLTPILFLSTAEEMNDKMKEIVAGSVDYIPKPFQPIEILARVQSHLEIRRLHHELEGRNLRFQEQVLQRERLEQELQVNRTHLTEVTKQLHRSTAELHKLHAAVEQNPASVIITDARGVIEYVNRKFTEVTGYSLEEVRGKTPAFLKTAETPAEVYIELWNTISQGRIWSGLFCNMRKDGTRIWERASIAPVRALETTEITHYIAVEEDITAQREIENQLHQSQKMEAIGRLAAGIAHEINTPTQFVSDNLFFLKGAFPDLLDLLAIYRRTLETLSKIPGQELLVANIQLAEAHADIEYVASNGPAAFESSLEGLKRIANIVRAMKEFSHPDQREMAPANINSALDNTLTIARNEYKYVADVEKNYGEIPPVMCHVGDLGQVFLNLLVNASHAIGDIMRTTGKRGVIRVRTLTESGFVRIEITDTGTGIPESAQEHIFEPFFTTKEIGKGTGQGLALAHNVIVKRHKGTLTFETAAGKGTTFIIRLPTREAELESAEASMLTKSKEEHPAKDSNEG
jgi:PAS domain S-box-containing protein